MRIDCLLTNTKYLKSLGDVIEIMGLEMAEKGMPATLDDIYTQLRDVHNLEVDIETAATLYADRLPIQSDASFDSLDKLEERSGRIFRDNAEYLIKRPDKKGEQQIGELSPSHEAARKLVRSFAEEGIADLRTSSELKNIQNLYEKSVGALIDKALKGKQPEIPFDEIVKNALERNKLGYEDEVTHQINNLAMVHEEAKKELSRYLDTLNEAINSESDIAKKAELIHQRNEFDKRFKDFNEAKQEVTFIKKEAAEVIKGALINEGFGNKENTAIDWKKVSKKFEKDPQAAQESIKKTVEKALDAKGFSEQERNMVSESISREYRKLSEKLEDFRKKQEAAHQQEFDNVINDIINKPPKTGELQESDMPTGEFVARRLVRAFADEGIEDKRTKTALRELEDIYRKSVRRLIPTTDKSTPDTRTFAEMVQEVLDRNKKEWKDPITGVITNLKAMHDNAKIELKKHLDEMKARGASAADIARFEQHFEDFNNHLYDTVLMSNEGDKILRGALTEAGYGGKDGKGLNWTKLAGDINSIADLRDNVIKALKSQGFDDATANTIANSLQKEYIKLKASVDQYKLNQLAAREKAMDRKPSPRKSDLIRLAELGQLGLFDNLHNTLLQKVTGIDNIKAKHIARLQDIAETTTQILREFDGKQEEAQFLLNHLQRDVVSIIQENANDHAKVVKIANTIQNLARIGNLALISHPLNVLENNLSGAFAVAEANALLFKEVGLSINQKELWRAIRQDIAKGGVEYGGTGDKFGHSLGALHWFDKEGKNTTEKIVKLIARPFVSFMRANSAGSDAANKAVATNKAFMYMLHNAISLSENQRIDKELAAGTITAQQAEEQRSKIKETTANTLMEAYHGTTFEKTKASAEKFITKYGDKVGLPTDKKARERAAIRLANDMVVGSLRMDYKIDEDFIKSALDASLHATGLALGHEVDERNVFAQGAKATKMHFAQQEQNAMRIARKTGQFGNKLATQKMVTTLLNDGFMKLMVGRLNWGWLRLEEAGLGLWTASQDWKPSDKLDLDNKEELTEQMTSMLKAKKSQVRVVSGFIKNAALLSSVMMFGALRQKEEDENPDENALQSGVNGILHNYFTKRMFNKIAPSLAYGVAQGMASKNEGAGAAAEGALKSLLNDFSTNEEYTLQGRLLNITKNLSQGTAKGNAKAMGIAGEEAGNILNILPIYSVASDYVHMAGQLTGLEEMESHYKNHYSFIGGLFASSGFGQAGVFDKTEPVYAIPGIGDKNAEKLIHAGYENMQDIEEGFKENPTKMKRLLHQSLKSNEYKKAMHNLHTAWGLEIPEKEYEGWNKLESTK